jgi:hypothetical protein
MAGWRDIRGAMKNHANILYHWFNQRYKTPDRTILESKMQRGNKLKSAGKKDHILWRCGGEGFN